MTNRGGQGTVEYLLVLTAVVLAILFGVRAGGPIQSGIGEVVADAGEVMTNAVNEAAGRLGL